MYPISRSTRWTVRMLVASVTGALRTVGKAKQVSKGESICKGVPIRIALIAALMMLVAAGSAFAFQALPPGGQVNDDLAAGIDKTISISGEDPTNADVVGGALIAGKPAVPWTVFRQQETNGSPPPHDRRTHRSMG